MGDIATVWDPLNGRGDWTVAGADLQAGSDLVTAVFISLFTDRRADPGEEIPDGSEDRRGWWGDDGQAYPVGSKIWLRLRNKQTQATLDQVRDDIVHALQWLIDDAVVSTIDVLTEWTKPSLLGARVRLHRVGGPPIALQYSWAWQGI